MSPIRLEPVEPHGLHQAWPLIEKGLATCITQDVLSPWLSDVYAMVKAGGASLYLLRDEGDEYRGFVILQLVTHPWSGAKIMHIWYAHGEGILAAGFAAVEAFAVKGGYSAVTFTSERGAFERLMEPLGFEVRQMEFIKRLA